MLAAGKMCDAVAVNDTTGTIAEYRIKTLAADRCDGCEGMSEVFILKNVRINAGAIGRDCKCRACDGFDCRFVW